MVFRTFGPAAAERSNGTVELSPLLYIVLCRWCSCCLLQQVRCLIRILLCSVCLYIAPKSLLLLRRLRSPRQSTKTGRD